MNWLTKISLKNSTAVVILCLLVLGYGVYSAMQIKQETLPTMEFPTVFVQVTDPGASTEEMESEVTNPIEDSLKGLKDYDSLTSTSAENSSTIVIQFPFGSDMDKLTSDVEDAVNKVSLPEQAELTVQRLSLNNQAIYEAAIFSDALNTTELEEKLQNEVLPQLQKIDGVSSAELKGATSESLEIVVDKDKAVEQGITLSAIRSALQSLDYAVPLGSASVNETTIPVKLSGELTSLTQIENLKLSSGSNDVLLSQLAEINTVATQEEITRYNGEPSFLLEVSKNQDANTASVADEVKSVLTDFEENGDFNIHVISDQGESTKESVSGLIKEGLFGMLFCMIIIFAFLRNIRATLISIVSLPISIFATIAVMNQLGYTLNIMTLGGIAVSVGRIVDDSIVVIENIYRWKQKRGNDHKGKELAYLATREVMGAVASSTIAMVVVFGPLIFVGGMVGQIFRPFALAVVISILASLFVAAMLIPIMGGKFFKKVKPHKEDGRLIHFFEKTIRGALKRKALVLAMSVILLVGSICLVPLLGLSFLPSESEPSISVEITLPTNSTLNDTDKVGSQVESYMKNLPGAQSYEISIGGSQDSMSSTGTNTNKAVATVYFDKGRELEPVVDQMNKELTSLVSAEFEGTTVEAKTASSSSTGNDVAVSIYSNDPEQLSVVSKQVEDVMKQNSALKEITNNMNEVTPKWVVTLNQKGIDLNVSPSQVTQLVSEQLRPLDAGEYTIDDDYRKITMEYKQSIASLDELQNIQVMTESGIMKLSDIADVTVENAWVQVNHDDGRMYAEVSGIVKDGESVQSVTKQVEDEVNALTLPSGVEVSFGGGLDSINAGFTSLIIAIIVAIGLVFLVMSVTFGGIATPLIILSSLIFIPVESLGALLITGESLSISAMIGMLMLVGIVVTNAVVLLDRVEKNRLSGMPAREAIVEASTTRLRPILMTAFATMLALLPVALSGSDSSATSVVSGGLAITVIGGLFTSTLLTLIVVPVLYELVWSKRKAKEFETF